MTQPTTADLYYLVRGGILMIKPVSLEAVKWFKENKRSVVMPGFYRFFASYHSEISEGTFKTSSLGITKQFTAKKIQE